MEPALRLRRHLAHVTLPSRRNLNGNDLTGTIPPQLGLLTELEEL